MPTMRQRISHLVIFAVVCVGLGCGDVELTGGSAVAALARSVRIVGAPTRTMDVGETSLLSLEVKDQAGSLVNGATTFWATTDSSIVRINKSGIVDAVRPGQAIVTAFVGDLSASISISVAGEVTSISVAPTAPRLKVGQQLQLTASLRDALGTNVANRPVTWQSADQSIASVGLTSAMVSGISGGTVSRTVQIAASSGRVVTTVSVTVFPIVTRITVTPVSPSVLTGATLQLAATAFDYLGNVVSGVSTTWTSDDISIAAISSSGLVTGISGGTSTRATQIRARMAEQTAANTITVIKR